MTRPEPALAGLGAILLLDKPAGISSARAVARVRRCFANARAGHGGSLDPLATGLLPVYLGYATRFAAYCLSAQKGYRARIRLGVRTDTDDMAGHIVETVADKRPSPEQVRQAVLSLTGELEQLPPRYSAVKVDGVRAYKLARRGRDPQLRPRRVHIHRFEILAYDYPALDVDIDCSKGTYIRSIARDIGEKLGVCGAIESLRRTSVSGFDCRANHPLADIEAAAAQGRDLDGFLLGADAGLGHLPCARLDKEQLARLYSGLGIELGQGQGEESTAVGAWRAYDQAGRFIGLIDRLNDAEAKAKRLIPASITESGPSR